jgi:hypothetical protein
VHNKHIKVNYYKNVNTSTKKTQSKDLSQVSPKFYSFYCGLITNYVSHKTNKKSATLNETDILNKKNKTNKKMLGCINTLIREYGLEKASYKNIYNKETKKKSRGLIGYKMIKNTIIV